ncbi:MAG: hypothetical protein WCV86_05400 [Patescibacteria group bacterium]|jgi:hypothetical protein
MKTITVTEEELKLITGALRCEADTILSGILWDCPTVVEIAMKKDEKDLRDLAEKLERV